MHTNVIEHNLSTGRAVERPLGPLEQWFYVMDQNRASHFSMAVQVMSEIFRAECIVALAKLQSRHPLLKVSIEAHTGTATSFRSVPEALIPLREAARRGSHSWKDELEKEAGFPIDTTKAPLMRAVLLNGDNRSEVIFTIHHSVTDATGLLLLFRDFFSLLSGRELEALSLPQPVESIREGLGRPSQIGVVSEHGSVTHNSPMTYRPRTATVTVTVMRLSVEETDRIVRATRVHGVTVHAALTAALVIGGRGLSDRWKNAPVRVFSPINLREELRMPEEVALVLGAGAIRFEVEDIPPFWDAARQALRDLAPFRTHESNFFLGQILGQVAAAPDTAAAVTAEHFGYELMLSNLGRIRLEVGTERLKVRDVWGPSVTFGFDHEQSVGVLTYEDALHLTHVSAAPIKGLLPHAVELLLAASE